jgi:hypothetical protein
MKPMLAQPKLLPARQRIDAVSVEPFYDPDAVVAAASLARFSCARPKAPDKISQTAATDHAR